MSAVEREAVDDNIHSERGDLPLIMLLFVAFPAFPSKTPITK